MRIIDLTEPEVISSGSCCVALGRFDGVHIAHRSLIERAREEQQRRNDGTLLGVFTFYDAMKGDITTFIEGAKALKTLKAGSRILIAEACTHIPQNEDIGRVKLPAMLRKKISPELNIEIVSGHEFPQDLTCYDLVIHCGACMFNSRHVLNRIARARIQQVPITNYGITIASLTGILDRITY